MYRCDAQGRMDRERRARVEAVLGRAHWICERKRGSKWARRLHHKAERRRWKQDPDARHGYNRYNGWES